MYSVPFIASGLPAIRPRMESSANWYTRVMRSAVVIADVVAFGSSLSGSGWDGCWAVAAVAATTENEAAKMRMGRIGVRLEIKAQATARIGRKLYRRMAARVAQRCEGARIHASLALESR